MVHATKPRNVKVTALVFGLLPIVLGLGIAQVLRWTDTIWLSTGGSFWPITLSIISIALLVRLLFSDFIDGTSATAAWLTLLGTWFYAPLWAAAVEVPNSAAVISRDGRVHLVQDTSRYPEYRVWLLTDRPGVRIVHNVSGKIISSALEIEYRYAEPYIATRQHGEDLSEPLTRAASTILREEVQRPRSWKIALLENGDAQQRLLARICASAVGNGSACPLKMKMLPQIEATALGETWSKYYSEREAVAEEHLPTLVRLLTQPDSSIVDRDSVFGLVLEHADSVKTLAQIAQRPFLLADDQFNELVRRILASPDCGDDVIAVLSGAKRLTAEQRRSLRAKALGEAAVGKIVANAASLSISDADIAQLAPRMRDAFVVDPDVAVRALEAFGERLPLETQRDAVRGIIKAKASYAIAALAHVNFSSELRNTLMTKVLSDASHEDFSATRLSKENLQMMLTPAEMRALVAMAVKRSETSKEWIELAVTLLPLRDMTMTERRSILIGLLFESPKLALEFVSKNRRYLEPAEVNEITRDYTRTIAVDFCLHLSHRNKNWRTDYFSEDQLQIFRDCAEAK